METAMISGNQIYNAFLAGYNNISKYREKINEINVFPVPDGDTGNNMVRTFGTIIKNLENSESAGKILDHIAELSLSGARGNSGIIMSQYLNGVSRAAGDCETYTFSEFGKAVKEAVKDAYSAVEKPEEGTILTVIHAWAETIFNESMHRISVSELFSRGYKTARIQLEKTTEQLNVLKQNKVVDAGAWGFVCFLEGIDHLNSGKYNIDELRKNFTATEKISPDISSHQSHSSIGEIPYRYCTELLMDRSPGHEERLRKKLNEMGDSLIISNGKRMTRIHIHTNSPAECVSYLRRYGNIIQQKVDDMYRQNQAVNAEPGRVGVITDSIADIPNELLDKYHIHVLNLNLLWDDEEFLDRLTITPDEFYRQQMIRRTFPGSSAPERERIDNLYEYLMEHYDKIIVLPVAKALSATMKVMSEAAASYNKNEKRIEVIDTCLNSAAQGLLVTEIAAAAAEGKDLSELKAIAEELKRRIKIYVSVSTFKYMIKGGRVSPLKGLAAKLMNLKPIVSLDEEGRGTAFEKAFSRKGLIKKITEIIRKTDETKGIDKYAVVHASALHEASEFAGVVSGITGFQPYYITDISPIVGMHSGKGAVAIAVIERS